MNKRIRGEFEEIIYKGEKTPFSLGTLTVVALCLLLLIVGTFTQLGIVHYWTVPDSETLFGMKKYSYIPQIPLVLFIAAILGARFGILVIILYLIVGFFIWPVFALGGGLGYIKSYFFGYILGYFFAMVFASRVLFFDKFSYKSIAYASVVGVLSIHFCGILYTGVLGIFRLVNFSFIKEALSTLSGDKIIYDVVFSFIFIAASIPIKQFLWLAMKNYSKPKRDARTTREAREMRRIEREKAQGV
ncbi:MAG: biotin transporter BioY [Candidatus Gastranaerophilales bacterium]|nr:biotin transporter BioY [Candidatus Gastranaerophilales bacterium]